MNDKLT